MTTETLETVFFARNTSSNEVLLWSEVLELKKLLFPSDKLQHMVNKPNDNERIFY